MVVLAWLYPRAAFWVLDRDGIKGQYGESPLKSASADDDEEMGEPELPKGIGALHVPDRHIYCLDMRDFNQHEPYVNEIRRIAEECRARHDQKHAHRAEAAPTIVPLGLNFGPESPATTVAGFAPDQLLKPPAAAGTR